MLTKLGLAQMYLQLELQQWGANNVYLSVLFSWKVKIAENPIAGITVTNLVNFCATPLFRRPQVSPGVSREGKSSTEFKFGSLVR